MIIQDRLPDEISLTPDAAGRLRSADGRVELDLPRGAAATPLRLAYATAPDVPAAAGRTHFTFRLTATSADAVAPSRLAAPARLRWRLAGEPAAGERPDLRLARFEPDQADWQEVAATWDPECACLSAEIEALGLYAVSAPAALDSTPAYTYEPATQVRGARAELYSGAIAYTYPFALPPGQGDLTPLLGLGYHSGRHHVVTGHYSLPGIGWQVLGQNYITRNPENLMDIRVVLNGATYSLEIVSGVWFIKENPLIKVVAYEQPSGSVPYYVIKIKTPDGTLYQFQGNANVSNSSPVAWPPMVYRWRNEDCSGGTDPDWITLPLHAVVDQRGNRIDYSWLVQTTSEAGRHGAADQARSQTGCPYIRTLRLEKLSYNQGRSRAVFDYIASDRYDRPEYWNEAGYRFFPIHRLTAVRVQALKHNQDPATESNWLAVRRYDLAQVVSEPAQTKLATLELNGISEGSGALSLTTSVSYRDPDGWEDDWDALDQITGPYGGQVSFTTASGTCNSTTACRAETRTEYDQVTARTFGWSYAGSSWNDDAGGFAAVKVTLPDGTLEFHEFHQMVQINGQDRDHLAGRTKKVTVCGGESGGVCSGELARTETDWSHSSADLPLWNYSQISEENKPRFVYVAEQRTYDVGAAVTRSTYQYQKDHQAGTQGQKQYGNVTQVEEYAGANGGAQFSATPYRTTGTWFYPNDSDGPDADTDNDYIVNLPGLVKTYSGSATGTLFAEERLHYDLKTDGVTPQDFWTQPLKGLLTQDETVWVKDGVYGNVVSRTFGYDAANGNPAWAKDALGNQVTYFYDSWQRAFQVCEQGPVSLTTKRTYAAVPGDGTCNTAAASTGQPAGAFGQLEAETDPNNVTVSYQYDDLARLVQAIRPPDTQATTTYTFQAPLAPGLNQPFWVREKQRDGSTGDGFRHTLRYYDGFGRLIQVLGEFDATQHTEVTTDYTWRDLLKHQGLSVLASGDLATTLPAYRSPGDWSTLPDAYRQYDRLGRLVRITQPLATEVSTVDYSVGSTGGETRLLEGAIDAAGRLTVTASDPFGRVRQVAQYTGAYTSPLNWSLPTAYAVADYAYDLAGRLTQATGPAPNADGSGTRAVTSVTYDGFGRKTQLSDPDMGQWGYDYDAAGRLTRQTDARSQTVCFYYDAAGRPTGKHYRSDTICPTSNPPLDVSYSYDFGTYGKTRRTGMTDPSGSASWTYDARGRLATETKNVTGSGWFSPSGATTRATGWRR